MVYTRRAIGRRFTKRFKKYPMPLRITRPILRSSINSGIHSFKRSAVVDINLINNTALSSGIGCFCNGGASSTNTVTPLELSRLPNYTEFVALFDQYQLNAVKFKFIYDRNTSSVNAQLVANLYNGIPTFYGVEDKDDAIPLTTINEYLENEHVKIRRLDKPFSIYVKNPCLAMMAYESAASTGYVRKGKQWVDCADESVDHFAFKWAIDASNCIDVTTNQSAGRLKVITTWYFKTRDVR